MWGNKYMTAQSASGAVQRPPEPERIFDENYEEIPIHTLYECPDRHVCHVGRLHDALFCRQAHSPPPLTTPFCVNGTPIIYFVAAPCEGVYSVSIFDYSITDAFGNTVTFI